MFRYKNGEIVTCRFLYEDFIGNWYEITFKNGNNITCHESDIERID